MFDLFGLNKFRIDWVECSSKIDKSVWEELFPADIEGEWWYETLEKSEIESQFKFLYAVVKRDKETIAIAPAFVMNVPIELVMPDMVLKVIDVVAPMLPNLRHQRTFFIGSPCADEGTIGIKNGFSLNEFSELLQDSAERKAKEFNACMIVWKDFSDSYKPALMKLVEKKNLFSMPSFPGTAIYLQDREMATYWQNLKGSRRHNLKKKLKKSRESAELESSVIQNPDSKTLQDIFALFLNTYEKGKTKFEKLNIKFFQLAAALPVSYFVLLREKQSSELVAFMLCFRLKEKIINKFIGLDYAKPLQWFLYFRLWEASLEWVLDQGGKEYQSGQTGYRFKLDVGNSLVPLTNYCKHTNPIVSTIFANFAKEISWSTLDDDLKVFLSAHPDAEKPNSAGTAP